MFHKAHLPLAFFLLTASAASVAVGQTAATPARCYPPLTLATASVPGATVGAPYDITLKAKGGQPPYRWSFGRSGLPAGFSLSQSGDLTGTAPAAGSYGFHVVVSDSLHNNVTRPLTLTVAANRAPSSPSQPTPPPSQPTPPPSTPTLPTPPTSPPPSTYPPKGKKLTACQDITKGGKYYLANDVSSAGTCFGIDANNIRLNLNGHTITYGTGGGSSPTPAIEGHACWYTTGYFAGGYCGKHHDSAEVYNGTIVQSKNAAPFSGIFSFGEGVTQPPYIHNITATFQNRGADFYHSRYVKPGARIVNNVIYDNVTNIQREGQGMLSARSAFNGQAILIQSGRNNPGVGDVISGNKIVGSPQGGIRSDNQNTVIANNDISMDALYSNDFCVDIPADGQVVKNNNCHPVSGRGFHINAGNDIVSGNTITVTELKQNAEYGGCEHGGTYGIQLEDDAFQHHGPAGATITGNTITAKAGDCDAIGIRLTSLSATSGATFSGNTITTSNTGGAGKDYGISADAANADGVSIQSNTFRSDYAYVALAWDGVKALHIGRNTWLGSPKYIVDAEDGGCSSSDVYASCPSSIQLTDSLSGTVKCYLGSNARLTIGGHAATCKAGKQNTTIHIP